MAKTVILMMDSFGIGGAKDAAAFGDAGANTFLHIAQNYPEFGGNGLALPNLEALGLANARASWRPVSVLRWCRGGRK